MSIIWNPWHGCHKFSPGCQHCYVYRRDESIGKNPAEVVKTASFDLPVQKKRDGSYRIPAGETVYAVMTSDFFVEEADGWREDIWRMIHQREDVQFIIITKRIVRFSSCLPDDWGNGYPNVTVGCTCENGEAAAQRLPIFLSLPIADRFVTCEPLLPPILLEPWLESGKIRAVIAGGESGDGARVCDFDWVLDIREQCRRTGVAFHFKQTGLHFRKDGHLYTIPRPLQQTQAQKAGIDLEASLDAPCQN